MDCFVRFAHSFCIRSRHEAESLARLEIDVGGMGSHLEPDRRFFQRVELREELSLGELSLGEACLSLGRECR